LDVEELVTHDRDGDRQRDRGHGEQQQDPALVIEDEPGPVDDDHRDDSQQQPQQLAPHQVAPRSFALRPAQAAAHVPHDEGGDHREVAGEQERVGHRQPRRLPRPHRRRLDLPAAQRDPRRAGAQPEHEEQGGNRDGPQHRPPPCRGQRPGREEQQRQRQAQPDTERPRARVDGHQQFEHGQRPTVRRTVRHDRDHGGGGQVGQPERQEEPADRVPRPVARHDHATHREGGAHRGVGHQVAADRVGPTEADRERATDRHRRLGDGKREQRVRPSHQFMVGYAVPGGIGIASRYTRATPRPRRTAGRCGRADCRRP
jgi:hypothetical protein